MNNSDLLKRLVDIALAEVGTREEGGNNCGSEIREYQKATWLEPGPWAWCAALQCWLLREWLKDKDVMGVLELTPATAELWRCKDASAFGWEKWAKSKGLQVLPETVKARAGDLVIFDFSHIGIVTANQVGATISTCEGNTSAAGGRDSETSDGVWLKKRHFALTKCYIRLLDNSTPIA